MIITTVEEIDKSKFKIYIDWEYHFILYKQDIKRYNISEGIELSDMEYRTVLEETVLRRGKQKALALLKYMDRTEAELILKLKQGGYTDSIVDEIIYYVKSYHYVDDFRYASTYIRYKKENKSKLQLKMELKQKGISSEIIKEVIEKEYSEDEDENLAILKAIGKKTKDINNLDIEEKAKLTRYLYRKGFNVELIKKYVN